MRDEYLEYVVTTEFSAKNIFRALLQFDQPLKQGKVNYIDRERKTRDSRATFGFSISVQ